MGTKKEKLKETFKRKFTGMTFNGICLNGKDTNIEIILVHTNDFDIIKPKDIDIEDLDKVEKVRFYGKVKISEENEDGNGYSTDGFGYYYQVEVDIKYVNEVFDIYISNPIFSKQPYY